MTDNYRKKLIKKLEEAIVYITYTADDHEYDRPFTLLSNLIDGEIVNDNEQNITCWDLIDDKIVSLNRDSILGYSMVGNVDDIKSYNKQNLAVVEKDKKEIKELSKAINEDISQLYYRDNINRKEFHIMKKFGIKKLSHLHNNTKTALTKIKKVWKTALTERKQEVVDLLNKEKADAKKAKDDAMVKDLETIEKTFSDIDATVDKELKDLKTVQEVFDYWPNLLLPPPKELLSYKGAYTGKYNS